MLVQITNAGAIKLAAGEIALPTVKLGSGFGYVPDVGAVALAGSQVWVGKPSKPEYSSATLLKYSVLLDYQVGPFTYGEIGLYAADGTLCLLVVSQTQIVKDVPTTTGLGESQRMDLYVEVRDGTYKAWAALAESSDKFRLSVLSSADLLPTAVAATPNAYLVNSAADGAGAFMAYTDRQGMWSFDAYVASGSAAITTPGSKSLVMDAKDWQSEWNPTTIGKVILQFSSGILKGTCRIVDSATKSFDEKTVAIGVVLPLGIKPAVGDTFTMYVLNAIKDANVVLPIAGPDVLGGIKLGDGLTISLNGVVSVDFQHAPVTRVNNKAGDVTLGIDDIADAHKVAKSGSYTDLVDVPEPLRAATNTRLGGIKVDQESFTVSQDGFLAFGVTPVTKVNGVVPNEDGHVVIPIDYSASGEQVGASSRTKEFKLTQLLPQRIAYKVASFDLGEDRASEILVSVTEEREDEINVQLSKLLVTVGTHRMKAVEYGLVTTGKEFPLSVSLENSKVVLRVDASQVSVTEDVLRANTGVNLATSGAMPSAWRPAGRQQSDPVLVLATGPAPSLYAPSEVPMWSSAHLSCEGLPVLRCAFSSHLWVGYTERGMCTSADRLSWTRVATSNQIEQYLASTNKVLTGDEVLFYDVAAAKFVFLNPVQGLTFDSADGINWGVSSRQLPLNGLNPATLQYVDCLADPGLRQIGASGKVQALQGPQWVDIGAIPVLAFAYDRTSNTWGYLINSANQVAVVLDGGNAESKITVLAGSFATTDVLHLLPTLPQSTAAGEKSAFWVFGDNKTEAVYLSVIENKQALSLTVSGVRTSLF